MPASMISAPTGGSPKVIGSSMAMVATGPIPGSTPISVPTSAPTRQRNGLTGMNPKNSLSGERATQKPSARLPRRSVMVSSLANRDHAREDHSGVSHSCHSGDQDGDEGRDDEPERPDRRREGQDGGRDEDRTAHRVALDLGADGNQA